MTTAPTAGNTYYHLGIDPTELDEIAGVWTPIESEPDNSYETINGSLKVIRECKNGFNVLVIQGATGQSKWVDINDLQKQGLDLAFYDADPTYLPEGETP